ncbi:MAG: response regulator [Spirochaetes bacterium]|nr:response regulator [Spirochaetota bacterium]
MADTKRVLVIDDDPDITDSITAVLKGNGFEAQAAKSGEEGLAAIESFRPHLVLCDMMMERIDAGSRVAAEIRKRDSALPLYLLSSIGNATAQNVDPGSLGFSGVFQKPVSPDQLIRTIKKALGME